MSKWKYQTTVRHFIGEEEPGNQQEEDYINIEADAGWELIGPPLEHKEEEMWVYYWRKERRYHPTTYKEIED